MEAFKIKKHIESEVLNLPIPKELIGREAEIIVLVESNDMPEKISKPNRKPGSAKGMIWMSDARLFLSAASAWEMAIKVQVGKLELPESVIEFTRKQLLLNDIDSLDVSTEHALTLFNLPLHHKDPFDRRLIAQAMVEDMAIITKDDMIKPYEVRDRKSVV